MALHQGPCCKGPLRHHHYPAMDRRRPPESTRLLRTSTPSSCLYSSTTTMKSHIGHSSIDFYNLSYVFETCVLLQCLPSYALTRSAHSAFSTTGAMFLKQYPCCRRKNIDRRTIFLLSETKPLLQKLSQTRPYCRKKNFTAKHFFSF